jgi:hypothetical protein
MVGLDFAVAGMVLICSVNGVKDRAGMGRLSARNWNSIGLVVCAVKDNKPDWSGC